MSLKKFGSRDIITNTMRTHPSCEFFVFDGKVYYNNIPYASGAINRGASVPISAGYASLYEMNVDRLSSSIADQWDPDGELASRFIGAIADDDGRPVPSDIVDNGLIYPYVTKDGTRLSLKTLYTGSTYEMDFLYGDIVSGSYPLSASIARKLIGWYPVNEGSDVDFLPANGPYGADGSGGSRGAGQLDTGDLCLVPPETSDECLDAESADGGAEYCKDRLAGPYTEDGSTPLKNNGFEDISCNRPRWRSYSALKNLFTRYEYMSEHFALTSSYGIKDHQIINLISIPSIFYGSKIKPGTVSLKWYLTGTLIGELQDTKQNGELIEITTSNPYIEQYGAGNVAGVIFYNEGFIALTGSWYLNEADGTAADNGSKVYTKSQITIRSGSGNTPYPPMWIDWGAGANDNCNKLTTSTSGSTTPSSVAASNNFESASFGLSFKGTSDVQTLTMFAHAKKGEANFSNNPTFLVHTHSATSSFVTSSYSYVEDPDRLIFNFASSSQVDFSASFKRQVYVSKVGIFDENKNLIGIASLASPVRKEEDQDLTFKLKLDI